MMKKTYRIKKDGSIEGLYCDLLADVGQPQVRRASKVEPSDDGLWTVELLVGRFKGCFIPQRFRYRSDALLAEVDLLNQEIQQGHLSFS